MGRTYKEVDRLTPSDRVLAIFGSINFKDYTPMDQTLLGERFLNYFEDSKCAKEFYFIFHDETDTYHLHYLVIFNKQRYVKDILNSFADCLGVEVDAINIRKMLHRNASLRYLVHQTNDSIKKGKKRYEWYEIVSNINTGLIKAFIESKSDDNKIDIFTLEGICVQCGGDLLKIVEFLDELYTSRVSRLVSIILERYSVVKMRFEENEELPF